jgi:holliday junction DNA helicase RuvA
MIGRLRGDIVECSDEEVLVDVGGVGYWVRCGVRTLSQLSNLASVCLRIESQTREDGTKLYGFLDADSLKTFRALIAVQGVGPKAALAVMDVLTPGQLAKAVREDDKTAVGRATGVGPKLAQRIVLELKGKALTLEVFEPSVGDNPVSGAIVHGSIDAQTHQDARLALVGLGIAEAQARRAVELAMNDKELSDRDSIDLKTLIRLSLKQVAR